MTAGRLGLAVFKTIHFDLEHSISTQPPVQGAAFFAFPLSGGPNLV
ncbi:hypothetical protein ABID49_000313 [Bhargavaea ullalensis]|uniref:Uncharacterized protein n=1 Tax=Bhargavaea ullalensis TaxID=1265685 RepID=A0ABV2G817_9BACL